MKTLIEMKEAKARAVIILAHIEKYFERTSMPNVQRCIVCG